MPVTPEQFKSAMAKFASGVVIITTEYNNSYFGFTASSLCSVSLDPPLLLFCLNKASMSWPAFQKSSKFTISILAETQIDYAKNFASKRLNKFADVKYTLGSYSSSPLIAEAICWIECDKTAEYPGGDHSIFIGAVIKVQIPEVAAPPLLHFSHQYRTLS